MLVGTALSGEAERIGIQGSESRYVILSDSRAADFSLRKRVDSPVHRMARTFARAEATRLGIVYGAADFSLRERADTRVAQHKLSCARMIFSPAGRTMVAGDSQSLEVVCSTATARRAGESPARSLATDAPRAAFTRSLATQSPCNAFTRNKPTKWAPE